MEFYNNILCVSGSDLIQGGLINFNTYKSLVKRNRVRVVRRGGGEGNPALIAFDSLPAKYKAAVKATGVDVEAEAASKPFIDSIEPDAEAQKFFADFVFDDSSHITEEKQARYVNEACILNAIRKVYDDTMNTRKRSGKKLPAKFWEKAAGAIERAMSKYKDCAAESKPFGGKSFNPRRLRDKFDKYVASGYASLIHGNWGNDNSAKICGEAGEWILARWAAPVNRAATIGQLLDEYNYRVRSEKSDGWDIIKKEATLIAFLNLPENKRRWIGLRFGELDFKETYVRQHRTLLPTMRDSLWYSDGTKLNYYYQDKDGKICTCYVYEVIDAYSEVFLGYHVGSTENYEMQYHAFKAAIQFAGCRPYELKYDNQGGHKKLENGDLLKRLAHLSIRTAPYNGKSKTIESAFGRFQSYYLKKDWYFTGQNITAKKEESRANQEFILANKAKLPTLDEVKAQYAKRRTEWNNAPHPKIEGKTRIEAYKSSHNDKAVKVGFVDIINMFGITTANPSTYRANGIEIKVNNVEYAFEVLTGENKPDLDFNRQNIGKKFYVRYCLEDMSVVSLYEKTASGMKFVDVAQDYIAIHRNIQEQEDGEQEFINEMRIAGNNERKQARAEMEDILKKYGEHPDQYGLKMPNLKGIGKQQKAISEMTAAETAEKLKKQQARTTAKAEQAEADEYSDSRAHYLKNKIAALVDE